MSPIVRCGGDVCPKRLLSLIAANCRNLKPEKPSARFFIVFMEPRRIVREFRLPHDRPCDFDSLEAGPEMASVKSEVMRLFEATGSSEEDV